MSETDSKKYLDLIRATEEFLRVKMEKLDEEASGEGEPKKKDLSASMHITRICNAGEFIHSKTREEIAERIGLHGLLSDILESVYQWVLKDREVRETGAYESIRRHIPEYMAECRKQLRALEEAKSIIPTPGALAEGYIADNRLELILTALRKTVEFNLVVDREYKFSHLALWVGLALCGIALISLLSYLTLGIIDGTTLFLSAFKEYYPLFESVNPTYFAETALDTVLRVSFAVSAVFLIIYVIATKIYIKTLKRRSEEGNVSARFVLAYYRIIPFAISVKPNAEAYVYEVMACAESGYPPALYRVGRMYELGYGRLVKPDKRLALQYYSKAAISEKNARARYEVISRNFN